MQKKILKEGEDARKAILAGVTKLYTHVAATLGPKGRNILIEDANGNPMITKDGVTVANEIELTDPFENLGASLVKQAARKTNDIAGDGTTTATILAKSMMEAAMEYLGKGANPILIKRGMDKCTKLLVEKLKEMSKPINSREDYEAVANISSQDPEVGKMIALVIDELGDDGIITIETGQSFGLEKRIVEGMQFDAGYKSPYFINGTDNLATLENCAVLVTDARISDIQQIIPVLEALQQKGIKDVAIIAEDIDGEALQILVVNKLKNVIRCVCIKAPGFGTLKTDILNDICAVTGATIASADTGLPVEKARIEHVGFCKKLTCTQSVTTILGGKGTAEAVSARAEEVKASIPSLESEYMQEQASKRIARMTGGIAVISVGGATPSEQQERQHRVEDALSATKAAAAEGVVPGGGTALIRAFASLTDDEISTGEGKDEAIGFQIISDAVLEPLSVIALNAGKNLEEVLDEVLEGEDDYGYNALTDKFGPLLEMKVLDPTLVTRSALENAVSVASMFITLEGIVALKPMGTQEKALAAMMGPQGQQ